jgi:hypothetical protein
MKILILAYNQAKFGINNYTNNNNKDKDRDKDDRVR